jgi:hypothetical protein
MGNQPSKKNRSLEPAEEMALDVSKTKREKLEGDRDDGFEVTAAASIHRANTGTGWPWFLEIDSRVRCCCDVTCCVAFICSGARAIYRL